MTAPFHDQATFDAWMSGIKAKDFENTGILTLGQLTDKLGSIPMHKVVKAGIDGKLFNVESVDSYRGYYSDLALEPGKESTVAQLLNELYTADGGTYTGYKGGDYYMDSGTLMWVSNYGEASGLMVVGVVETDEYALILTEHKEY